MDELPPKPASVTYVANWRAIILLVLFLVLTALVGQVTVVGATLMVVGLILGLAVSGILARHRQRAAGDEVDPIADSGQWPYVTGGPTVLPFDSTDSN